MWFLSSSTYNKVRHRVEIRERMKVVSATDVFELGKFGVKSPPLETTINVSYTEIKTLVHSPTEPGSYSVLLFLHGYLLLNSDYGRLLDHISSHGYIVVAPQLYGQLNINFDGNEEVELAAGVTNWISTGLPSVGLPAGVNANIESLALAGHSRGGKQAFALALGKAQTPTTLKPSVLIGLDPVAGTGIGPVEIRETEPCILTHSSHSFALDIPVIVIGSGLWGLCTPEGLNHDEFFFESKPPSAHIVAKHYGHLDMLNDGAEPIGPVVCPSNIFSDKDPLRRCIGGVFVAALRAFLQGKTDDFNAIVVNKTVEPPVTLDPLKYDQGPTIKARL